MIKKVLLAMPNTKWFGLRYWYTSPYTLGLLYACLKDKYEVKILDANIKDMSFEEAKEKISEFNPDIVGITCMSLEYDKIFRKMASLVKEVNKDIIVVVGGIYPTLLPQRLDTEDIDFIVMGEGEYKFPLLIEQLNNNMKLEKVQPVTEYIEDLDSLPFPCYDDIDINEYINTAARYAYFTYPKAFPYAFIISARGCPFNCIYCSSKLINGPKIRYRSAESLIEEIKELKNKYGIKEIIFMDDNIYLDKKRIKTFMNLLIKEKIGIKWKSVNAAVYALDDEMMELMKKSGCYQIALAIESGTEKGLKLMKKPYKDLNIVRRIVKKAKELGFELGGLFIIGIPGETWEDIRKTIKFAEELELDQVSFNIATPLPCTELYYESKKNGYLPENFSFDDLDFYGFGNAVITTSEFTPEDLMILRAFEWDRVNFKTEEKEKKIAEMCGLTLDEVKQWRKLTRKNIGVKVLEK